MATNICSVIPAESVSFDIAGTKEDIIRQLVELATRRLELPAADRTKLSKQVLAREMSGSTGVGCVGIPHVKTSLVPETVGALAVFPGGVDFKAVDGEEVYSVFLILSPTGAADEHIAILRCVASLVRGTDYNRFVRQTKNAKEVWNLLGEMSG